MSTEKNRALVLSGGGANGAYEVGVVKALVSGVSPATGKQPLDPDMFCGTSIGSFNAAFLASQWDEFASSAVSNLEAVWLERLVSTPASCRSETFRFRGNPFAVLNPACYFPNPLRPISEFVQDTSELVWDYTQRLVNLFIGEEDLSQRAVELLSFASFISTEPWQESIRREINFDNIMRTDCRPLRIAAVNWTTGELKIFANHEMTRTLGPQVVAGSSGVPGIVPPTMIGAEPHVDGGILMNSPLKPMLGLGADEVHMIYLDPEIKNIPLSRIGNTLSSLFRLQVIGWAQKVNDDIEDCQAINHGLEVIERTRRGEAISDLELEQIIKSVRGILSDEQRVVLSRYRPVTIHRHHPRDDLGGGALGFLDFSRGRVEELIDRGFRETARHDCVASQCVIAHIDQPATPEEPTE